MEYRLLPINSCLQCRYCRQKKDGSYYAGYCVYGADIYAILDGSGKKLLWETESSQCVTGKIPDWCQLEKHIEIDM